MLNLRNLVYREPFLTILSIVLLVIAIISPNTLITSINSMDYRSLFTLLALLITSKAVEFSGAINILSRKMLLFSHRKQFYLVLLIVLSTFLLSSIFTNDAVLFILIPLSLAFSKRIDISRSEIIALVVLAANTGSIMTPFGNPQNIIIWKYYDVDLLFFIYSMIPYSLIGLVVLIIYTYTCPREKIRSYSYPWDQGFSFQIYCFDRFIITTYYSL